MSGKLAEALVRAGVNAADAYDVEEELGLRKDGSVNLTATTSSDGGIGIKTVQALTLAGYNAVQLSDSAVYMLRTSAASPSQLVIGRDFPVGLYPLDGIAESPVAAYANKKLRSAYTGPCLRVVRPSDSATLDIGFVGSVLDVAALSAFLGSEIGQVDTWYDQSGNGYHATQTTAATRPQISSSVPIGGSPALYSANQKMSIPAGVAMQRQSVDIFAVFANYTSYDIGAIIQLGSGSANQISVYYGKSNGAVSGGYIGFGSLTPMDLKPQAAPRVLRATSVSSGVSVAYDGLTVSQAAVSDLAMTGGTLFGTDYPPGYVGDTHAGAVIIFNKKISDTSATSLTQKLVAEYYGASNGDGLLLFSGDSITIASAPSTLLSDGYAKEVVRNLGAKPVVCNIAVAGSQLQNDLPNFSTIEAAILGRFAALNRVVFLFKGTNDLKVGGRSADQIYGDIVTYAGLCRAAGAKIIVSTILPDKAWTAAEQATRDALNRKIRAGWYGFADGFCDFAADPVIGPQAAASDTSLYPDGLHPSRLAHRTYMAPLAKLAIEGLFSK